MTTGPEGGRTTVLLVCTGNVCRSPAAELLLREVMGTVDVTVASAGTRALAGQPIHPPMAQLLAEAGVTAEPFAARQMTAEHVQEADLVLAMAREHRSAVVRLVPAALRRTLLLSEAAMAAAASRAAGWPDDLAPTPAARLAALADLAPRHRSPDRDAAAGDVPDPFQRSARTYRTSFAMLDDAVRRLGAAVR